MQKSNVKKVLVIGGTGAIGRHTVKELLNEHHLVDVLSVDTVSSDNPNLQYITGNAFDISFMRKLLETTHYDGIIDYMTYDTIQFVDRFQMLLDHTDHYIFLSSYRVYAEDAVITEESPRLLDVSEDKEFLKTDDYSLFKARMENILRSSKYRNWTIVRPSITYSEKRYQMVVWEAEVLIPRILAGKKIVLPIAARNVESAMTYAGDSGKMFAKLLFNEKAFGETYTLATAEHHPWSYVADCYTELLGAQFEWIDTDDYLRIKSGSEEISLVAKYQLEYDRLFNRVVDNTKVLKATGLKQEDFMPLKDGLCTVLNAADLKSIEWNLPVKIDEMMDQYLEGRKL